ncbi:MAG: trigger factor [Fusobacteriaceae bacterium]|nr:trigger factor [Fusobacteriaceae bacterium]MBP6322265.1 trigger factor [Fusobacteriaceae bacterium]MBP9509573.1 trigger factor [Fusobacteriaceae bacterium]
MKHLVTRKENSAVEVKLTLTKEEVSPIKETILKTLATKVEVPGFRKGHAPLDKVEANFPDAVKEELVDSILKANYETVLSAENINPVSYIYNVKAEKVNDEFELTFMVDEFPAIKLAEYKGLTVEKRVIEFKEETLTTEIDALLNRKSSLVDAEEGYKAVMGDTVDLAFDGYIDGVAFDGGKSDSHQLKLGSHMFIDNFEEQLVGYTVGQEGEVNVTFPAEYGHAPLAGKPAVFKVKINAIKKTVTPELNDETAKELGFESVEDLKAKKKEEIIAREESIVKNEATAKLINMISDATEIAIPNSMIMREVENKVKEMEQHLSMQGANMEMYLKMIGKTFEDMVKEMRPMCQSKVKADLILEEIAKVEKLTVTEEEMEAKMAEIAKMYGMDSVKLVEELNKHNNLESFKQNLNVDITLEKAVDFILANTK